VYELYTTWSYYGLYNFLANPNLNPETSFSWDLGLEQKLGYNSVIKLNYFHNIIDSYIYPKTISFNPITYATDYQNENAGKAETDGVELEMETKPYNCLKLFSSATYTHSEMLENSADPLSVGNQLPWVPEWMFNLGGEVTYRDFTFTLTGRYVSKQYGNADNTDKVNGVYGSYDPFFTADFCARYKLTKWATLDFSIKNIMDRNYFSYYQAPGRQFFGGVTAKF
jgi:iron complex outermembrane receptor protein